MSLLRHESGTEIDDAARGESFTRGTSHIVLASVVAAILVTAAIAFYVKMGERPPVATGEILQVWTTQRHVETSGVDANGDPAARRSFDQVLIFAHVKLKNQGSYPLYLEDMLANLRRPDSLLSVSAGSAGQIQEALAAFPDLASLNAAPLPPLATLPPGKTLDGIAFWAVRMNKKEWNSCRLLNFTFEFHYQPALVLTPHAPAKEL
ncbi:MAG: hypothetical protein ACP5FH_11725 [Terracidiphilus sp.]